MLLNETVSDNIKRFKLLNFYIGLGCDL